VAFPRGGLKKGENKMTHWKTKSIPLICIVVSIYGCAIMAPTPVLSAAGQNVRLIINDPPAECKEIGDISGSPTQGRLDIGKINLRNKAAEIGATHVRLDQAIQEVIPALGGGPLRVNGTAYKCPPMGSHEMP
jgi:hypothetical protein